MLVWPLSDLLARYDFLPSGIAGTAHFDFVIVKKNKYTIFVDRITAILYIERDIFSVFGSKSNTQKTAYCVILELPLFTVLYWQFSAKIVRFRALVVRS